MHDAIDRLTAFLAGHRRVLVLTGAGCSTDSGIPDYRDANGEWKHAEPVRYQQFVSDEATRRRYWARSAVGWRRIAEARPNAAHHALAALEASGVVHGLITQNVDGLHSRAGSRRVIDLHGRLDTVRCLACGALSGRTEFQERLLACNPHLVAAVPETIAPDGDAAVAIDYAATRVPPCAGCGGTLKPHVVFFGEGVPPARVADAFAMLDAADALLVVGSSLMVYSGYRFVQAAARTGKPIAAVNLGRTRADDHIALKITLPCGEALAAAVQLGGDRSHFSDVH